MCVLLLLFTSSFSNFTKERVLSISITEVLTKTDSSVIRAHNPLIYAMFTTENIAYELTFAHR